MKIDCRGLECPEPVLNTKKSLELLPNDSKLEVLVDNEAAKENVKRFASNAGCSVSDEITADGDVKVVILKGFECDITKADETQDEEKVELLDRVLFLKSDRVGEDELGSMLAVGFLKNLLEIDAPPRKIICVNRAVFLTTADDDADITQVFKALEAKGVEIYSCGICLDFYKVADKLKVGVVGNAYDTVDTVMNSDKVITL